MFFAKEGTLSPLVTAMNLTSTDCLTQKYKNQTVTALNCVDPPSFSSNMIIELHEDDAFENFIRVKYNGEYVNLCGEKKTECEYHLFWRGLSTDRAAYNKSCYGK